MHEGQLVFSQVTNHLPMHFFRRCVQRYQGERYVKRFRCLDQFMIMALAQLTHRVSLRDIETCLRAQNKKLYHMGYSNDDIPEHTGRCQRTTKLEYPRRLCPIADQDCTSSLRRREPGNRTRQYHLRSRRIYDLSLPFHFPLGAVPLHQVSGQTPHSTGFAWKYSDLHPYLRLQAT